MVKADLDIVSHIVLDDKTLFRKQSERKLGLQLGGPVAYATVAIPLFSSMVRGITAYGSDLPTKYVSFLTSFDNYTIHNNPSKCTTKFHHEIHHEYRTMYVNSLANPLDNFFMDLEKAKNCFISPVFHEIKPKTVLKAKSEYDGIVAGDIQGFIRNKDREGKISKNFQDPFLQDLIKKLDIVKYSINEVKGATHKTSLKDILSSLPKNNIQIITMGNRDLIYSNRGKHFKLTPPNVKELDPTGAGDVFMTAFLLKYIQTQELDFALSFGCALASEHVKTLGITKQPKKRVDELVTQILETKKQLI